VKLARKVGAKVFARVLPNPESLKKALSCALKEDQVAVLHPSRMPKSGEIERALCRIWSIDCVICRQSGGLTENLWRRISKNNDIKLFMIRRPPEIRNPDSFRSLTDILERITIVKS